MKLLIFGCNQMYPVTATATRIAAPKDACLLQPATVISWMNVMPARVEAMITLAKVHMHMTGITVNTCKSLLDVLDTGIKPL